MSNEMIQSHSIMNILITGHKGFVGRHFVKHFASNKKHRIVGIDIVDGQDCRDFFKTDVTKKGYWDLVIHLAAIVGGRQTIESDPIAVAIDLSIDAELFNWAVRQKPKKLSIFLAAPRIQLHYKQNRGATYSQNLISILPKWHNLT